MSNVESNTTSQMAVHELIRQIIEQNASCDKQMSEILDQLAVRSTQQLSLALNLFRLG